MKLIRKLTNDVFVASGLEYVDVVGSTVCSAVVSTGDGVPSAEVLVSAGVLVSASMDVEGTTVAETVVGASDVPMV